MSAPAQSHSHPAQKVGMGVGSVSPLPLQTVAGSRTEARATHLPAERGGIVTSDLNGKAQQAHTPLTNLRAPPPPPLQPSRDRNLAAASSLPANAQAQAPSPPERQEPPIENPLWITLTSPKWAHRKLLSLPASTVSHQLKKSAQRTPSQTVLLPKSHLSAGHALPLETRDPWISPSPAWS